MGSEVGDPTARDDSEVRKVIEELRLRPRMARRDEAVLARYVDDMRRAVGEVARVLVPGGTAVYVIGENTIRGTYIRNAVIVRAAAELAGLRLVQRRVRTLPGNRRYLPPPKGGADAAGLDTRMRREVLLTFERPAA